jgi:hypothetical protein
MPFLEVRTPRNLIAKTPVSKLLLGHSGHSMTQWLDASPPSCDSCGMLEKSAARNQKSERRGKKPEFQIQKTDTGPSEFGRRVFFQTFLRVSGLWISDSTRRGLKRERRRSRLWAFELKRSVTVCNAYFLCGLWYARFKTNPFQVADLTQFYAVY